MMKNINIEIINTREIRPQDVRIEMDRVIELGKFKNNFEVIEYVPCGNLKGRFMCVHKGYFFTIPIDHVKKI